MSEDTAFDGVRVTIDTVARARGAVLLLHGFTRHPRHLDLLAGRFVDAGVMVVRPHLASLSPVASMNRPSVLARAARSIAEAIGDPRLPLVVVGHSAGAAAGSGIAAHLLDAGAFVRGLVLVDGVESPTRSIERAWPRIGQLPMFCVCAPPSRCNRQGALAEWLRSRRTGAFGVVVRGAGHGDIEGQEHAVYRWACGDASSPAIRDVTADLVLGAALAMLDDRPVGPVLERVQSHSGPELPIDLLVGAGGMLDT